MKSILTRISLTLALLSPLALPLAANAHSQHTANVCSTTATDICAHIGYEELTSTQPATFMTHFMPKAGSPAAADPKLITNVKVSIWMDMGTSSHSGPPVSVKQLDDVHFEVSDANFTMAGPWLVKLTFDFNGQTSEIVIPVTVQ